MEKLIENENVRQTYERDEKKIERPKKIRSCDIGALRVKQPEELMGIPAASDLSEDNPSFYPDVNPDDPEKPIYYPVDPSAKFGPRVTAQQLTRALENLQTTIRNERKSGIPESDDEIQTESPLSDHFLPRVNFVSSMMTEIPPKSTSNTNVRQTAGCIIWVHLQASICTEWEQNSMVLTPGSNIGARVTANPPTAGNPDTSPTVPTVGGSKVSATLQALASSDLSGNQKKPKTIHRCILQRTSKSRSHEASLTCHVCQASYGCYDAYYNHLVDKTCAKNNAARVTSPSLGKTVESRIEKKLLQSLQRSHSLTTSILSTSEDDEDIHIEAEFLKGSPALSISKQCSTATISSTTPSAALTSSTTTATMSSSLSSSICSTTATTTITTTTSTQQQPPMLVSAPVIKSSKRGRPFKLNLATTLTTTTTTATAKQPTFITTPPILAKRPYSITEDNNSTVPLNLSKRVSQEEPPTTPLELDLPPLLPIHGSRHFQLMKRQRRDVLGSTGSGGGETSSTETSPNAKDVFSDQYEFGNVFSNGVKIYGTKNGIMTEVGNVRNENSSDNIFVNFDNADSTTNIFQSKRGIDGLLSLSEAIKVQQQRQHEDGLRMASEAFHQMPRIVEASICPHLAAASLPALSLTDHANDQSKLANLKILLTKLLATSFGEEHLCGPLNYPETDILTILSNVIESTTRLTAMQVSDNCAEHCQRLSTSLPQSQLRFRTLRREIFVARQNVANFLKTLYPDSWESNAWGRKSIEHVLDEILASVVTQMSGQEFQNTY